MVARLWGCDRVPPLCKQREQDSPEIRGRVKSISCGGVPVAHGSLLAKDRCILFFMRQPHQVSVSEKECIGEERYISRSHVRGTTPCSG